MNEDLSRRSGYMILYNGEFRSKKGPISYSDLQEPFHAFSMFLTFLNGRRCSPFFKQGVHNEEVLWTDYKGYSINQYKYVFTWPTEFIVDGLNGIWKIFYELWKSEEDKDFLVTAVHWYVEANGNAGLIDGAIIMAQTALELIYNWLLIERKKLLIGKDADIISASNKIRLLLSHLEVSTDFPELCSDLKSIPDIVDAPDGLVQIRNALVHAQADKRKKLLKISFEVKAHALHLGVWYIELALLKILGYEGYYKNRTSKNNLSIKGPVPWKKDIKPN
jgi:hypothetical protein